MTEDNNQKLSGFPYIIGGLSFIPLIGVLFGIVAIIWGLVTKKTGGKKLAIIGALGIVSTIVIYSAIFYFGFIKRGGVYDDLRIKLAQTNITQLVQAIEFYKVQNKTYPVSLEELKKSLPEKSMIFIADPTDVHMQGESRNFYYERIDDNHYYLLGVGMDGKPFTKDDILPTIPSAPKGGVGLLIKPLKENSL